MVNITRPIYKQTLNCTLSMLCTGVKTLVKLCLSVIVRSEEVMTLVPTLPPKHQTLINAAYEAHTHSPPFPSITYALQ